MARSYGRVLSTIWADEDWTALTRGAQHTYMLLLSQPKLTLVGLLDYLPSRWARLATDSDLASVEADIDELETSRFVLVDRHTDELLIRTFVRHDLRTIQANANLIKGMWGAWATIQSDRLRRAVVESIPEDLWITSRCQPHPEALQMRRSPRLEPMVQTDGSDQQSQPPSSLLLPPSTIPSSKPSSHSPHTGTAAAAATDLEADAPPDTLSEAIDLLVTAELERNPTRNGNPARHATAVRNGKLRDHRAAAHRHLTSHPDLTAGELADLLEPPAPVLSLVPRHGGGTDPLAGQRAALAARAERNQRALDGQTCQTCQDTGWVDADDGVVPCTHPDHQETIR